MDGERRKKKYRHAGGGGNLSRRQAAFWQREVVNKTVSGRADCSANGGEEEEAEEEKKPVNSIQIGKFVSQSERDAAKPQGGVTPFPKHTLSPHQCPVSSQTFSREAFQTISRFTD